MFSVLIGVAALTKEATPASMVDVALKLRQPATQLLLCENDLSTSKVVSLLFGKSRQRPISTGLGLEFSTTRLFNWPSDANVVVTCAAASCREFTVTLYRRGKIGPTLAELDGEVGKDYIISGDLPFLKMIYNRLKDTPKLHYSMYFRLYNDKADQLKIVGECP